MLDHAIVYRFGDFTLDSVSGDLWQGGKSSHLQPQPLQLLLLLLHDAGRVVTRQEIRSSLWPQDTYVEFDDGLNHAIRRLREALGDTAQVPRYVETVPRRGYRFIAPVALEGTTEIFDAPASIRLFSRQLVLWSLTAVLIIAAVLTILLLPHHPVPRIESLAVLPFTNFSDDADQEYFADGLTEELTTEMSRTTSLRVISRTSSMRLKNSKLSLREIGRDLGVDAVIEGSVQRSGGKVRISAQLVRVNTEGHVWAETYERDLKDVLRVRGEIARDIAVQVRNRLALRDPSMEARSISPQAYDAYLMGTRLASRGSVDGYEKSIAYLERAIALDPQFGLAYTQLAESHAMLAFWSSDRGEHFRKALAYSDEAMRIDSGLAEAQIGDAALKFYWESDWSECDGTFRRLAQTYPNSQKAQYEYGLCLYVLGHLDEALAYLQNAHRLDPFSPLIDRLLARLLALMHRDREAIEWLLQARDLEPDNSDPYTVLALLYRRLGKDSEAFASYITGRRLLGKPVSELEALDRAYRSGGIEAFEEERQRQLRVELKSLVAQKPPVQPRVVAALCASIPDTDCALAYLEKAYNDRDPMLCWLKSSLAWESLHNDPHYHALVRRIGLPD